MPRKKRKKSAKRITLNPNFWLRNSDDVKTYREKVLYEQKGKCAVSGVNITTGCLDHTHINGIGEDGRVRGVLLSEVNVLEGRYLKLFNKLKLEQKYDINFPDFLINLGRYLKQDNSNNLLHFKYMEEFRKSVDRLLKDDIQSKLEREFGVKCDGLKSELVRLYVQCWVDKIEGEIK